MIPVRFPIAILIIIFIIASVFILARAAAPAQLIERTRLCMGTMVEIRAGVPSGWQRQRAEALIDKAFAEIGRIEGVFSVFKTDSEISKINALASDAPVETTGEVCALVERCLAYSKKTNGAFDITVKPLVGLWDRAKELKDVPSESAISAAAAKVGFRYLKVDAADKTVYFQRQGMALDLGGVAKGYAADRAAAMLMANGIRDAIVNLGGNMYCLGSYSGREMWRIGIRHPRERGKILMALKVKDKAVVTSGDYERYFIAGGRRYSHIIDPRTGHSIGDDIVSATVIAKDAATADMLATALCVLGREGLDMVKDVEGADAVIIRKNGNSFETFTTGGFMERYGATQGQ